MDIGTYKRLSKNGTVHTTGERHSYEAQNIIEATWYDDPASTIGWFYDYTHDDEPDKNIGLHPEKSKTKIPIDIKYMLSSYRTLSKDEVDSRIMFKPSYRCNVPYYKELFEKPTNSVFPTGMFVDLMDDKGSWNRWLVVSTANANNHDFPTWSILPCGHKFQWVFDGKKQEMWGVERSQSSYTAGLWMDRVLETPDNITKCILPYNDITRNLFYNQRMIISVDLLQPLAWRISKVEPFANRGNILYTLKQDVFDEHHDYIERDEDGNIIGYWADMFSETNTPNNIPKKPEPELSGDYAEITYAGAEPHIKVKGSYKTITITYYNSNVALSNQTPGTWSYFIDGEDASSLVTTLSQSDPNKIKVKFMGDEEYLGKVLVIRNTRDDIIAELQLAIVAI